MLKVEFYIERRKFMTERDESVCYPKVYREVVLQGILRNTGPPGKNKTLWSARQRYFWPGMDRMISKKVEDCPRCTRCKTPAKPFPELVPIEKTRPIQ